MSAPGSPIVAGTPYSDEKLPSLGVSSPALNTLTSGDVLLKIRFPEAFPQSQKAVRMDGALTIQEVIFNVESLLNFPVPQIESIGLAIPDALWAQPAIKGSRLEALKKDSRSQFLDNASQLGCWTDLLSECGQTLELKYITNVAEPTLVKHKAHIDARQSVDLSNLINPANPKKIYKNFKGKPKKRWVLIFLCSDALYFNSFFLQLLEAVDLRKCAQRGML